MTTTHTIKIKTDTKILVCAAIVCDGNSVTDFHIEGSVPSKRFTDTVRCFDISLYHRTDGMERAVINAVRNAALLWERTNYRVDNGMTDGHTTADYEAICETIREGIAALLHRFPGHAYLNQHDAAQGLAGGIVTDLIVTTTND